MKKLPPFFAVLILFTSPSVSFAQHWLWVHDTSSVYEAGAAQNVALDPYGNVYCVGDTSLFKHDAATGMLKWQKTEYAGAEVTAVIADQAGNVYLYSDGYTSGAWWFYVLQKLDSSGTVIWTRTATQIDSGGQIFPWAIALDNFGHIYITGYYSAHGMIAGTDTLWNTYPTLNSYIIKYDTSGSLIWAKSITSPGGSGSLYGASTAYGISTDPSGNFFIVGTNYAGTLTIGDTTVPLACPVRNIYVIKFDSDCHVKWITSNRKVNEVIYDQRIYQIGTDGSGNTYIAGYYDEDDTLGSIPIHYPPGSNGKAFVAKYEAITGNVLWAKTGGAGLNPTGYVYSFATNLSGDSYLLFPSFDTSGFEDSVFASAYGNPTQSVTVVGLDSSGNVHCGFVLNGRSGDDLCGIGIDNSGYGYVCGDFIDSCKFGDTVVHGIYPEEYFVSKFTCSCVDFTIALPGSVTISASPGDTVCPGSTVTFTAIATSGGSPVYTWLVNGTGVGGGGTTYSYVPSEGDAIRCVVTNGDPCSTQYFDSSNTIFVHLVSVESPAITITVSPGDTVCSGDTVTFYATIAYGGPSPAYVWKKNGISLGAGTHTLSFVPSAGDSVKCTVTSSLSCLTVPFMVSNSIGIVVKKCNVGINDLKTQSVTIYPDPAFNKFTVSYPGPVDKGASISIADVSGRLLHTYPLKENETVITVADLAPGLYFCKINLDEDNAITKKLILLNSN